MTTTSKVPFGYKTNVGTQLLLGKHYNLLSNRQEEGETEGHTDLITVIRKQTGWSYRHKVLRAYLNLSEEVSLGKNDIELCFKRKVELKGRIRGMRNT